MAAPIRSSSVKLLGTLAHNASGRLAVVPGRRRKLMFTPQKTSTGR